jgi:hypothetical protein
MPVSYSAHRVQLVAPEATPSARLRGWRLGVARSVWLLIFVSFLSPYVMALPGYLYALEHPAADSVALSPGAVAALVRNGISLRVYAWVFLGALVAGLLVTVATSAILFWRRSDDWTALVVALFIALHPIGAATLSLGAGNPAHLAVGWVPIPLLAVVENALQFGVMLLFPTGRFIPRWSWLLIVAMCLADASTALPIHGIRAPIIIALAYPPLVAIAVACMVYRYRRISTPVQRLQTKWIMVGLVITPLANLVSWVPLTLTPLGQTLYAPIITLVYLLVQLVTPLAFFIAVQRYRLYNIDTIINRALVYGSLTAILGAIYTVMVIGAQALIGVVIHNPAPEQPIVLVGSTLLIATLLRPLRGGLQGVVDRRFYRHKYDAAHTLAAFSDALRHETDVVALREQLLTAVDETMRPAHASLWLLPTPGASGGPTLPSARRARS